jgi:hypothetical protein
MALLKKNDEIKSIITYWLSIRKYQMYDSLFTTITRAQTFLVMSA